MRPVPALFCLAALLLAGCADPRPEAPADDPEARGRAVLAAAREAHGSDRLDRAHVSFDFRDRHFEVRRDGGAFHYERTYTDSTGARVREVLSNDSLYRAVDGERLALPDSVLASVESGVNSAVYFALLPHALADAAVQPRWLGRSRIGGRAYDEVEVTFQPQGGGRDWEDRFVYWVSADSSTIDYLAYYFHVDDAGSRFREAYNVRRVGGVRWADYRNYTLDSLAIDSVEHYDSLYEAGALRHVSDIDLRNVRVAPLD